ncbi:hypothetical protein BDV96DRAFT_608056 [Lophiotrema nucula]|uniref:Uncharacterized protein n=1 Tax=Lophiotrema nucula TaxID=690887 RepID=A0A6A5YHH5_9PLEO|nr:hypothetical protein BDV96DRAFT_608056 [Lophiotrema nucula]
MSLIYNTIISHTQAMDFDPQGQIQRQTNNPIVKMFRYFVPKRQDSPIESDAAPAGPSTPSESQLSEPVFLQHPPRDSENNYEEYYCAVIPPSTGLPRSSVEKALRSTIYPAIWEDAAHGPNERIAWPNWTLGAFMNTKPSQFVQNSDFSHAALVEMIQNNFAFRPQTRYPPAVNEPWNEVYCKENSGEETQVRDKWNAYQRAEEMNPDFWNGEWFKDPKNCKTGSAQDPTSGLYYYDFKRLDAKIYLGRHFLSSMDLKFFDHDLKENNPQYYFAEGQCLTPTYSEDSESPFSGFDGVVKIPMSYSWVSDESFRCVGVGNGCGYETAGQSAPDSVSDPPARPKRPAPTETSSAPPFHITHSAALRCASAPAENFFAGTIQAQRPETTVPRVQKAEDDVPCCCNICKMNGDRPSGLQDDRLPNGIRDPKPDRDDEFKYPRVQVARTALFPETLLPEVDAFQKDGIWGEEFQAEKREAEHADGLTDGKVMFEREMERQAAAHLADIRKAIQEAQQSLGLPQKSSCETPPHTRQDDVDPGADLYVAWYDTEDIIVVDDLRKETAVLTDSQQHSRALAHNKAMEKQLRAYHRSNHNRANKLKREAESMAQSVSQLSPQRQEIEYFRDRQYATEYAQEVNPFEMVDVVVGAGSDRRAF